nr:MAG TPA: hypothetical protein [Bacteriophage sp.]
MTNHLQTILYFGSIKLLPSFISSGLMGILYTIHHMSRLRNEEKI